MPAPGKLWVIVQNIVYGLKLSFLVPGLNIKNSIVIIDEAHNLVETITNIHSVSVTGAMLGAAHAQLSQYRARYAARLKARNLLYIKQILFILASFIKLLGGAPGRDPGEVTSPGTRAETRLVDTAEFLATSQIYNLDLLKLIKYCNVSQICHKLNGFVEKYKGCEDENAAPAKTGVSAFLSSINKKGDQDGSKAKEAPPAVTDENRPPVTNSLQPLVEVLSCLCLDHGEARMVVTSGPRLQEASLRFLLLDPANQFRQIVTEAHSVLVAGGTMRPLSGEILFRPHLCEHS